MNNYKQCERCGVQLEGVYAQMHGECNLCEDLREGETVLGAEMLNHPPVRSAAFQQGYKAFSFDPGADTDPYSSGSTESNDWFAGWRTASYDLALGDNK